MERGDEEAGNEPLNDDPLGDDLEPVVEVDRLFVVVVRCNKFRKWISKRVV